MVEAEVVSALRVSPTLLYLVHGPHLVNVLSELVSYLFDVARQLDLWGGGGRGNNDMRVCVLVCIHKKCVYMCLHILYERVVGQNKVKEGRGYVLTMEVSTGLGTKTRSSWIGKGPARVPLCCSPK